MSVMVSNTF